MRSVKERHFFVIVLLSFFFCTISLLSQVHPDTFFGKKIGSDGTLISYSEIATYLKHLEASSKRIIIRDEGKSTLGSPMLLAVVSSEQNIENIDRLIKINKKLSRPDQLNDHEITQLLETAPIFVLITGTLHATEVAAAQMALPFTHFLATTTDPKWLKILNNSVLLLMPSINPDGHKLVTDWYHKTKGTVHDGAPLPYLYHHYAGHDNNRDYFMLNLAETQAVNAVLHHRYFPHIFLDMHQMGTRGPRMFVPPFKDPFNENLDPLLIREVDAIGSFMALKLQQFGKKGVASAYAFDAYWPGGSKNTAWYKNVVGLLTELASVNIASPIHIDANELDVRSKGLPEYKAQVNFPDPWPGGWWHLQDIIDYSRIAVEALLETASQNRHLFLNNYLAMGKRALDLPKATGIYGYLIPNQGQWDRGSAISLVSKMMEHGVDVHQVPLISEENNKIIGFEPGDFFISLAQPYSRFVKAMMEIQRYPTVKDGVDGDIVEPYDVAGWTLPLQMGVQYQTVTTKIDSERLQKINESDLRQSEKKTVPSGTYLLSGRENNSWKLINALLAKSANPPPQRITMAGAEAKTGDFLINVSPNNSQLISDIAKNNHIRLENVDPSNLKALSMKNPRIGIYQGDMGNMDEGWTRWVLDQYGFKYRSMKNSTFTNIDLTRHWDVILIPSISREAVIKGYNQGRHQAMADVIPPQYRDGIGERGITLLQDFVRKGKTLILLDSAWEIGAKDFSLPLRNQLEGRSSKELFIPGSLLRVKLNTNDPLAWGMPGESVLYFANSPVFRTSPSGKKTIVRHVVARFSDSGPHLLSGYAKGESYLDRGVTAVRFHVDKGQVVLFAGRIQHRSQTNATFKLLFNALFL